MNKVLKFKPELIGLILDGSKTSTWRLDDDKNLSADDILDFADSQSNQIFAKAVVTAVFKKAFNELTAEDKAGHESYKSDDEMLGWYSQVYKRPVSLKDKVKIIKFRLL